MPPPEESLWWRGKRGFEVGFFPCECVEIITTANSKAGGVNHTGVTGTTPSYKHSAVQMNSIKGCVSLVFVNATFDPIFLESRVHHFDY